MIIGIDASRVNSKERTGIERYSYNLIHTIAKIDHKNTYRLYLRPDYDRSLNNLPKNFQLKIINLKHFWTQIGLSWEILTNKPDALFVPAYTLPLFTPKNTTMTVHDLAWKYFPKAYSKLDLLLHQQSIKRAINKKAKLIVYSHSTLSDLKKYFKINQNLIHFVTMGFSAPEKVEMDDKFKKYQPYILSIGRLEKRKNSSNIIKSYLLLRKERKIKHKLLLVGKPGFGYEEVKKEIESSGKFRNDIIELGYVSDKDLSLLYQNATLLLYPSLYEGFGYPILEAFYYQIPVITSNLSSMPEVAKDASIMVNPNKIFEITAAMSQIINKPKLVETLNSKAKKIYPQYSWETCAKETLKVIMEK